MADQKAPSTPPAPDAPAQPAKVPPKPPVIVAREFGNDETRAMKSGADPDPSPLHVIVLKALETGRAQGVGYGDDYKKNTVLSHIRKAIDPNKGGKIKVPANLALRTFDRADYVVPADDPDTEMAGKPWPHIGFKFVEKPPTKVKPGEPSTQPDAAPADDAAPAAAQSE